MNPIVKEDNMNKKLYLSCFLIAIGLFTMGQSSSCNAPMDATGDYSGTWSFDVKDNGTVIDTIDCPLSMTLEQDVTLEVPDNLSVNGTIYVDYSCLEEIPDWPEWFTIPESSATKVTGSMDSAGKIYLASGGCTIAACALHLIEGQGETDNQTGADKQQVQRYSGTWGVAVGIAFLPTFGVSGTFRVERD
jgi:hypothetical protein